MSKLEDNMKTMERLFPEIYSLTVGHWYKHIPSGSVALYTGNFPAGLTFGINPLNDVVGRLLTPKDWNMAFFSRWFGSYEKLGHDWINIDMYHVIDMFKQYFAEKKGWKIGASVHYNKHDYIVTDDWYFDGDRLMVVCTNDIGSNTHLMLLSKKGINECIVVL